MESLPFQPTFCVSSTLNASHMNVNLVDVRGGQSVSYFAAHHFIMSNNTLQRLIVVTVLL